MPHDFSAEDNATSRISCAFEITITAATQSGRIATARDIWPISDRAARALRSELPIAWDREFISRDYGKTVRRRPAKGSPLGQVRASPGGEAGPSACRARANTNARARFLAGDGPLAPPPQKPQACIVCSELPSDRVNLGLPDSASVPRATSGGPRRNVSHDSFRHLPEVW